MRYTIDVLSCLDEDSLEALYGLSLAYFNEYAGHDTTNKIHELLIGHLDNYFSAFIGRPDRRACIAKVDGHIVGYCTFYEKQRQCFYEIQSIGEISGLFVDRNYRRTGIGKDLVGHAVAFFRTRRLQYFSLNTSINDKDGIEFFKKLGMYENNIVLHGEIKDS